MAAHLGGTHLFFLHIEIDNRGFSKKALFADDRAYVASAGALRRGPALGQRAQGKNRLCVAVYMSLYISLYI